MCRGLSEGGRRCPGCHPEQRAAYRKAHRAAQQGLPIGEGGTVLTPPTLAHVWDPQAVTEQCRVLSREADPVHETFNAEQKMRDTDEVERMGGFEPGLRGVGTKVAAEAEARAGITQAEITEDAAAFNGALDARLVVAKEHRDRAIKERDDANETLRKWNTARWALMEAKGATGKPGLDIAALEREEAVSREAAKADREQRDAANDRAQSAREIVNDICREQSAGASPQTQDDVRRLSAAYTEVLSEVRGMGGVEPQWHSKTKKSSAQAFSAVTGVFPTDWLNKHNDAAPVVAKETRRRAHYSMGAQQKTRKKVRAERFVLFMGEEHEGDAHSSYRELTAEESERVGSYSGETRKVRQDWKVHRPYSYEAATPENKPRGVGWEMYQTENGSAVWRRPVYEMKLVSSEYVPEITTTPGGGSTSTSMHEMGHRFQHVVPGGVPSGTRVS